MIKVGFLLFVSLLLASVLYPQQGSKPKQVTISSANNGFQLLVDGRPYFIKGAVGSDYLEKLKQYGGNSIRTGSRPSVLNKAHALGLTALVNLPVKAERDGMNYDDTAAVRIQHDTVMAIVQRTKAHPGVIMWALGNELDFIHANVQEHYNTRVWQAVNALAKEIHRVDPLHPVMTVVGSIDKEKIKDLLENCPDLDLLGVNEYGDLLKIPEWLRTYGWNKPYAVTEWGPTGFWQVPKTAWEVPIEETSSMKAARYKERYHNTILADKMCLGSFVFLWRQHQERTHTWFGMFDKDGLETEAVEVMHHGWTGKWPRNRVPRLDSMKVDSKTAYQNVYLKTGKTYTARAWVRDPDNDRLTYHWEVLPEGNEFPYGGNGERKPPAVTGLIDHTNNAQISFRSPGKEGAYRLFVYAYDGNRHWATANVPFYVHP